MILRWTPHALTSLDEAYAYIERENPTVASLVIDRIEAALSTLLVFPNAGREGRCLGTRELIITGTPFIIPYRIDKNTVEIVAVLHHARIWPEKL